MREKNDNIRYLSCNVCVCISSLFNEVGAVFKDVMDKPSFGSHGSHVYCFTAVQSELSKTYLHKQLDVHIA